MALPSTYRWVTVGKLIVRSRKNAPNYAPAFSVGDLFTAMADRIRRNAVHHPYSARSRLMWCADLKDDDDYYYMILQVGDQNVSGVSFLNFDTLASRDIEKKEEEGSHYASHVLVRKKSDEHGRHLILFERVPGIHLSSIKDHLTWICNDPMYEKKACDDKGKVKHFHPVFEIHGHQSKTIKEALQNGTLEDIEFVSMVESHGDGLDEESIVNEVVNEARWKIRKVVTEEQARKTFGRAIDFIETFGAGKDQKEMLIRIKTGNGQLKRTQVDLDGEEILEQAFVENEIVNDFDSPLTQRYEVFRDDMIEKIAKIGGKLGD